MPDRNRAIRELLAFYVEAGADAVLQEAPPDRTGEPIGAAAPLLPSTADQRSTAAERQSFLGAADRRAGSAGGRVAGPPPERQSAATIVAPPSPEVAAMAAREAAKAAQSLDALRAMLERFEGCTLRNGATQLVFAAGNPQARIMFVGEAPGRDEDLAGLPFVGRSGKLLDRMMAAIALDRTSAYIANVIFWRPPGNRTPTPQETQICLPFIRRQIELADPDILVCLGGPATQALIGVAEGIIKARGRWLSYQTGTREIRAIATLHPAYLLRQPLHKRLAWRDFLAIKKALGG